MPGTALLSIGICLALPLVRAWCWERPAERDLVAEPGLVRSWAGRLTNHNARDRTDALAALGALSPLPARSNTNTYVRQILSTTKDTKDTKDTKSTKACLPRRFASQRRQGVN